MAGAQGSGTIRARSDSVEVRDICMTVMHTMQ